MTDSVWQYSRAPRAASMMTLKMFPCSTCSEPDDGAEGDVDSDGEDGAVARAAGRGDSSAAALHKGTATGPGAALGVRQKRKKKIKVGALLEPYHPKSRKRLHTVLARVLVFSPRAHDTGALGLCPGAMKCAPSTQNKRPDEFQGFRASNPGVLNPANILSSSCTPY